MVSGLRFLINFLVPTLFFVVYRMAGTKPAIAFAIGAALIQTVIMKFRRLPISPFFVMGAVFTITFGTIDLFLKQPRFYRLEPGVQSLMMGLIFHGALLMKVPLLERFARALPTLVRPKLDDLPPGYLRNAAWTWIAYFYLKGAAYIYLAFHVNLGHLIVLRSVLGTFSVILMIGGEWLIRRHYLQKKRTQLNSP